MGLNNALRDKIVLTILVVLLVGGGFWRAIQQAAPGPQFIAAGPDETTGHDGEPELIVVHLAGAIHNPGIYHLPPGSRVYELLEKGGGLTEDADGDYLNQARPLLDGEQVYINRRGEMPLGSAAGAGGKVNINTASLAELTTLPGIGEVRAGQIIAHREQHGFFSDPSEIMDVGGIGATTYNNIAALITIY